MTGATKIIAIGAYSIGVSLGNGLQGGLQKQPILHNISLELAAGQWTSIVGPNGAGKSTLLKSWLACCPTAAA